MTVLQLRGPVVFRVLQWCHPMLASLMEDKLLYPDDHLIWCSKVDSGPRSVPGPGGVYLVGDVPGPGGVYLVRGGTWSWGDVPGQVLPPWTDTRL